MLASLTAFLSLPPVDVSNLEAFVLFTLALSSVELSSLLTAACIIASRLCLNYSVDSESLSLCWPHYSPMHFAASRKKPATEYRIKETVIYVTKILPQYFFLLFSTHIQINFLFSFFLLC